MSADTIVAAVLGCWLLLAVAHIAHLLRRVRDLTLQLAERDARIQAIRAHIRAESDDVDAEIEKINAWLRDNPLRAGG